MRSCWTFQRAAATAIITAMLTVASGCSDSDWDFDAQTGSTVADGTVPDGSPDSSPPPIAPGRSSASSTEAFPVEVSASDDEAATTATRDFLDRYLKDSGRVVRLDEGGDTVSEGQAYAMLLTAALGDEDRFADVWRWTEAHLQKPNKLLAWRWDDGAVADSGSASDADLLAAWALLKAGLRFDNGRYWRAGQAMASAVLERETIRIGDRRVLLAGPWARRSMPAFINPGYFAPPAFRALAKLTGQGAWSNLARTTRNITKQLTSGGKLLPDWARIDSDGTVTAVGKPGSGGEPPVYGLDAARSYVFLSASCYSRDHVLAAKAWPFFSDEMPDGVVLKYDVDGDRLTEHEHALTWVAVAATADAADEGDADAILDYAGEFSDEYPTYYGSAWVALGQVLLTTNWLYSC